ncbi:MAG: FGGY-family carbohydrate kinase [Clostridia bacterium]|nr:FGGY-family carbohydrate kinase [Clostridia bacterium]
MLLIGIDIGTTSVKGVLIDDQGRLVGDASREHDLISLQAGWAEEDPGIWWDGTLDVLRRLAMLASADGRKVRALAVSGMVPALILLDERGNPLRRSIQQNDARTHDEIAHLRDALDEQEVFKLTGGGINQQTIPPKLLWLQKHEPDVFGAARHIVGSYDYITYRLTGRLTLERNWALESGMFDVRLEEWIPATLDAARIHRDMLPAVMSPGQIVGPMLKSVADEVGLGDDVIVTIGSGDHVASAFSSGVRSDGDVLIKLGGAGDILACSGALKYDRRVFIDYHLIPGKFLPNGCMASSGSLVKWFVNSFFREEREKSESEGHNFYACLDELAAGIPAGSEGLVVLPYFVGEKTPLMDPLARGVFFGLSTYHTAAHIYRAILEAVGYGFMDHIRVFQDMGLNPKRFFMSNGGAKSVLWRQIVTDAVGSPVEYITHHPGSSLGAAFVAGMGIGAFGSWDDILAYIPDRTLMEPDMAKHETYMAYFDVYRNLYRHLKQDFRDLAGVS